MWCKAAGPTACTAEPCRSEKWSMRDWFCIRRTEKCLRGLLIAGGPLVFSLGLGATVVHAQASAAASLGVHVGTPVRVTGGRTNLPVVEPHLAVHPRIPHHLLAVAMVTTADTSWRVARAQQGCAAFLSRDGGQSWAQYDFDVFDCADPWVLLLPNGHAVVSMLAVSRQDTAAGAQLQVFHSSNAGTTWDIKPTPLGRGHDHPTLVADTSASTRAGWIYALSSHTAKGVDGIARRAVFIARSRDYGKSFDAPVRLQPSNLFLNAETAVILSDGTLVVAYTDDTTLPESESHRRGWIVRSTDGGQTFGIPHWISDACGPPRFALSMLAADASHGPYRNRLYFACNERGGASVVVTTAQDTATRWAPKVSPHTSAPDSGRWRHVRALAVGTTGSLAMLWTERSGLGSEARCFDVFVAASVDGGRSFLPPKQVSSGRSCVDRIANGAAVGSFPTGGDYYGLAATPDGHFHAVWVEAPAGAVLQLRSGTIEVRRNPR